MKKYELGTQIIYKELWKAAAAVKLWGKPYSYGEGLLVPLIEGDIGHYKPYSAFCPPVKQSEIWNADAWQLTIDTPEKQDWFMPQVGDYIYKNNSMFGVDVDYSKNPQGTCGVLAAKELVESGYVIVFRNNTPFPTPCEVIKP